MNCKERLTMMPTQAVASHSDVLLATGETREKRMEKRAQRQRKLLQFWGTAGAGATVVEGKCCKFESGAKLARTGK